jgi:hypothetical protein
MKPLDLTDFALSEQKIDPALLAPRPDAKVSFWKFAAACLLDNALVFVALSFLAPFLQVGLLAYAPAEKFETALTLNPNSYFSFIGIPLFLIYCCGSMFFNHGQSWGMRAMKIRFDLKGNSYRESMHWGLLYNVCMVSYGLYWFINAKNKVVFQDHRYQNLFKHEDWVHTDLCESAGQAKEIDIEFDRAA